MMKIKEICAAGCCKNTAPPKNFFKIKEICDSINNPNGKIYKQKQPLHRFPYIRLLFKPLNKNYMAELIINLRNDLGMKILIFWKPCFLRKCGMKLQDL